MGSDIEGDRIAWWWQMTEVATQECAGMCGTFGLYGGQGKYEGMTGEGIWERQTEHATGGFGIWLLDYSK